MTKLKNRFSESSRTFDRIQKCLIEHRCKQISYEYSNDGKIIGLSFGIEINGHIAGVRLPARVENVERILFASKHSKDYEARYAESRKEQAYKTAWANIRDWIEAQLALVDTEMVRMEEVFLPYIIIGNQTVFEKMVNDKFLLGDGK